MKGFDYLNPARVVFGDKPYEAIEKFLKYSGAESLMMIHRITMQT